MSPYEIIVHYHNVALTVLCERHIPYGVDFEDPRYYIIEQNPSVALIQSIIDESRRRSGHHRAHVRREQERCHNLEDEGSSGSEPEESLPEIVQRFHDRHKRVREETRRIDARARGGAGSPDELTQTTHLVQYQDLDRAILEMMVYTLSIMTLRTDS
jgi:hypothetical protein